MRMPAIDPWNTLGVINPLKGIIKAAKEIRHTRTETEAFLELEKIEELAKDIRLHVAKMRRYPWGEPPPMPISYPRITPIDDKPQPPPSHLVCDACGELPESGEHTNWLCRCFIWLRRNQ